MNPCTDLPPIVVSEVGRGYAVVCGCLWRTPTVQDLRSATQAHDAHRAESREAVGA